MLSSWMNRKIHLNTSDGTILRSLHVKSISALPVIDPGIELIENYSTVIQPLHKKITSNIRQIRTLEKLRDTLLPKLMSGEVRVRQN
jgi:type I restriction enzyme, S subunit